MTKITTLQKKANRELLQGLQVRNKVLIAKHGRSLRLLYKTSRNLGELEYASRIAFHQKGGEAGHAHSCSSIVLVTGL